MSELKNRSDVAAEFKWNLASLFESDEVWQARFDKAANFIALIEAHRGQIGKSAENLLAWLEFQGQVWTESSRLLVYASLSHDQDTTDPVYMGMRDKAMGLMTKIRAAQSFANPEIIAIGRKKVMKWAQESEELKIYRHLLDDLFREEKHILSPEKEEIMARAAEIGRAAGVIFNTLNNADMVFGKAVDSKGVEHNVTHGSMGSIIESTDRVLRESVFKAYRAPYVNQKNTIAAAYSYSVKNDNFVASVRGYSNAMDAALSGNNIPQEIYINLVNTVNNTGLPLFHRYLNLRKRCLGLDKLRMFDMAVPIVENADTFINWEDAKVAVVEGLAALGDEYQNLVQQGFDNRWVDVYENKGKRSGAYSWGTYDAPHPYVLMNFDNTISDMFTLAHEMGHALHTQYTNENQPPAYGGYTIFLAEVASTVNEALVMEHMLSNTKDKTKYNYLLNYFIQQFVGTFFRQTLLAEFEMRAHEMEYKGQPLNADSLSKLYRGLIENYYGNAGVELDEEIFYDWSRVPHFYRSYYVYQYATGFAAAMAFSKKIRDEGAPAVERYLSFLKSGSKDYSINLLKEAGLDMTSPQPINDALKIFEDLLDRFEKANFGDE